MSVNEKVHILYFIHDLAPFGAQRIVLLTVKYLDKKKFRVTVYSFWGEETLAPEFAKYGAEVVFLRARRFFDLFAWIKFVSLLFHKRPQIIHTTLPELSFPARLVALFLPGLCVVHTFQNPLSSEPLHWRFLNKITLRLCDAITFVSHGIADEVTKELLKIKDKVCVIQNAILLQDVHPDNCLKMREDLGITNNEKIIGCIGRLTRQKGQDILIEAIANLVKKRFPVRLVLVGDGELEESLRLKVKSLKLEKEVIFLGRRNDIARILAGLDIYVAPSRWEGFPLALSEAMLSGRPCIGTDIPGHSDLLMDKVTGITVSVEDPQALAEAIIWMFKHPEEARRMAFTAREIVQTNFTPEIMAKKYENLYLHLIQG
ncbi:MAG: glycosyltransferase [bacterium]|nr:glycosyltransferase [bacterium]